MVPAISVPMEGSTVILNEGSSIIIDCIATGFPQTMVVWERVDGSDLSNRLSMTNRVIDVVTTSVNVSLVVTEVSREDSGEYRCSASNRVGGDNKAISLVVQCK